MRDHAAEALGTAMKVVGEKGIMPFLADIEALKMGKVNLLGYLASVERVCG